MAAKEVCAYCNAKFVPPQSFCPKCHQPTPAASADERILWELSQWETTHGPSKRTRKAAPVAEPTAAQTPPPTPVQPAASKPPSEPASKPRVAPVAPPQRHVAVVPAPSPVQRPTIAPPAVQRPAASTPTPPTVEHARPAFKSSGVVRSIGRAPAAATSSVRAATGVLTAVAAPQIDTEPETIVVPEVVADVLPDILTAPAASERPSVATVVHRMRVPEQHPVNSQPAPAKAPKARKVRAPKVKAPKVKTPKQPKMKAPKAEKPAVAVAPAPAAKAPAARSKKVTEAPTSRTRLDLQPNEKIEFQARGRSRLLPATLIVTTYRVALVRLGRARWIPLEEVRSTASKRSGLTVEASVELFRFHARGAAFAGAVEAIDLALREARRPNSRRHDAAVTQAWCDRCEIWDSHTGRMRLWLNRHPLMIVTLVAALVALVKVYTR